MSGGVACNSELRAQAKAVAERLGLRLAIPEPRFCTDNGAMIAAAGALLAPAEDLLRQRRRRPEALGGPMEVTREDVLRCARLTDLNLREEEIEPLRLDMERLPQPCREPGTAFSRGCRAHHPRTGDHLDPPRRSGGPRFRSQAVALSNAPDSDRGLFRVPKVI